VGGDKIEDEVTCYSERTGAGGNSGSVFVNVVHVLQIFGRYYPMVMGIPLISTNDTILSSIKHLKSKSFSEMFYSV
jgi:hypothetical protein